MSLQQCKCDAVCISPASCPCVYRGLSFAMSFTCGKCGFDSQGYWPVAHHGKPWKALYLKCPNCKHFACVSFAGLPGRVQSNISTKCVQQEEVAEGPTCGPTPSAADETAIEWYERMRKMGAAG